MQAPAKCCNKSLAGTVCFQDNSLYHLLSCKIGGGVSFLHTALCTQLTKILKEAGLRAHREVPIPEFANVPKTAPVYDDDDVDPLELQNSKDAFMDLLANAPTGEEFLIDASIRNPLAQRYSESAFSHPGPAADVGEYDKKSRYPTTQGKAVLPCVMESFGRLGKDFHDCLEHLAFMTSGIRECDTTRPSQLRNNWLLDISSTINKAIKNSIIQFVGTWVYLLRAICRKMAFPESIIEKKIREFSAAFGKQKRETELHFFSLP